VCKGAAEALPRPCERAGHSSSSPTKGPSSTRPEVATRSVQRFSDLVAIPAATGQPSAGRRGGLFRCSVRDHTNAVVIGFRERIRPNVHRGPRHAQGCKAALEKRVSSEGRLQRPRGAPRVVRIGDPWDRGRLSSERRSVRRTRDGANFSRGVYPRSQGGGELIAAIQSQRSSEREPTISASNCVVMTWWLSKW
jgi:hypothetical protein